VSLEQEKRLAMMGMARTQWCVSRDSAEEFILNFFSLHADENARFFLFSPFIYCYQSNCHGKVLARELFRTDSMRRKISRLANIADLLLFFIRAIQYASLFNHTEKQRGGILVRSLYCDWNRMNEWIE
jgi:hypothetical protein